MTHTVHQLFQVHEEVLDYRSDYLINNGIPLRLSCETNLDEAREESCFLNPICDVEKLEDGEQLAEAHHKADGVESVC